MASQAEESLTYPDLKYYVFPRPPRSGNDSRYGSVSPTSRIHRRQRSGASSKSTCSHARRPRSAASKQAESAGSSSPTTTTTDTVAADDRILHAFEKKLQTERKQRMEDLQFFSKALRRVFSDFAKLSSHQSSRIADLDEKLEAIMHTHDGCDELLERLRQESDKVDGTVLPRLETAEKRIRQLSSLSQYLIPGNLLPTLSSSADSLWGVQVVFVLDAYQSNTDATIDPAHIPHLDTQSRNAAQHVLFSGDSSFAFTLGVQGSFASILQHRPWMPLARKTLPNQEFRLHRLPRRSLDADIWDKRFLDQECIVAIPRGDKEEEATVQLLFIALQHETLEWREIAALLPRTDAVAVESLDLLTAPAIPEKSSLRVAGASAADAWQTTTHSQSSSLQQSESIQEEPSDHASSAADVDETTPRRRIRSGRTARWMACWFY